MPTLCLLFGLGKKLQKKSFFRFLLLLFSVISFVFSAFRSPGFAAVYSIVIPVLLLDFTFIAILFYVSFSEKHFF